VDLRVRPDHRVLSGRWDPSDQPVIRAQLALWVLLVILVSLVSQEHLDRTDHRVMSALLDLPVLMEYLVLQARLVLPD